MKVKDFNPETFIARKMEGFRRQEEVLHRLYNLAVVASPEAQIHVSWYGLSQSLSVRLSGKEELKDVVSNLVDQGIELTKKFEETTGDFEYSYTDGIGQLTFASLPPNCKIVKKTKVIPTVKKHTKTYYEVECDDPRELPEEVGT